MPIPFGTTPLRWWFERGFVPVLGVVLEGQIPESVLFIGIIPSQTDFANHGISLKDEKSVLDDR